MNKVNHQAIKELLELEDSVALSIYMPTHRFPTSEHIAEDKIRFKNLMKSGAEALRYRGVDPAVSGQILAQLESDLYDSGSFWQHTTEGLAVFCSPAGVQYFHLPIECEEHVSAGDSYNIAPLLISASFDQPYYILALAVKNPVLFKADMYGVERVAIDLPESPEKALGIDELHSNSKTVRAGGYGGGNPGMKSHGQGDSRQAGQEERLKFFRMIDSVLLASKDVEADLPFLLAGTDHEVSGYREVSRLQRLLNGNLSGNYTDASVGDIHTLAWQLIVEELCDPERTHNIERVHSLLGTGKASVDSDAVAAAAAEGRIDALLVGMVTRTRDSVGDAKGTVMKLVFTEKYRVDTVSKSVRSVFERGGKVIGTLKDAMPYGEIGAAVYRY